MRRRAGIAIIINACIWGFVMIMISYTLRGTGAYQEIQLILGGGAVASMMAVGTGFLQKKK